MGIARETQLIRISEPHPRDTAAESHPMSTPELVAWPHHELDGQTTTHLANNLTTLKAATRSSVISTMLNEQLSRLTPKNGKTELDVITHALSTLALYRYTGQALVEQVVGKALPSRLNGEQIEFVSQTIADGIAAADRHPTDSVLTSVRQQATRLISILQHAYYPSKEAIARLAAQSKEAPVDQSLPGIFGNTAYIGRNGLDHITDSLHDTALGYATSGMLPPDTIEEINLIRNGNVVQPSNLAEVLAADMHLYRLLAAPETTNTQLYFALRAAIENVSIAMAMNLDNSQIDLEPAREFRNQLQERLNEINNTMGSSYPHLNNDWYYGIKEPAAEEPFYDLVQMAHPTAVRAYQDSKGQTIRWAPEHIVAANPTSHLARVAGRIQRLAIGEQLSSGLTLIPADQVWPAYLAACKSLDITQPAVTASLLEVAEDVPATEITAAVINTLKQKGATKSFGGLRYPLAAATGAGALGRFINRVEALPTDQQIACTGSRAVGSLDISDLQTAAESAGRTARTVTTTPEAEEIRRLPTLVEMQTHFAAEFPTVPLEIITRNCATILKAFTMAIRSSGHELIDQPESQVPRTVSALVTGPSRTGKSYVIKQMLAEATKLWAEPMGLKPVICDVQASALSTEAFQGKKWHDGITTAIRELTQSTGMRVKDAADMIRRQPIFLVLDEADKIIIIDPTANGDAAQIAMTVQNEMRTVMDPGAGVITIAYRDAESGSSVNINFPTDNIFTWVISSFSRHQDVIRGVMRAKGYFNLPLDRWMGIPNSEVLAAIPSVPPDLPNRFAHFDVYPALTPKDAEIALTSPTSANPLRALQADIQLYSPGLGLDTNGAFVAEREAIQAMVEHAKPRLAARGYAAIVEDQITRLNTAFQNNPGLFPIIDGTIHLTRDTVDKVLGIKR